MPEELFDVYAKRNPETGEPELGDCSLHLGDGTEIVQFTKGFARVPRHTAEWLHEKRGDVTVPALSGDVAVASANPLDQLSPEERAAVEAIRAKQHNDPNPPGQRAVDEAPNVEESDAEELDRREPVPAPAPAEQPHGAKPLEPGTPEHAAALELAKEHLQEEEEEVPDPAATVPATQDSHGEALIAKTAEGVDRCQALKTDGKQCNNAAIDGPTCNLTGHVAQHATEAEPKTEAPE